MPLNSLPLRPTTITATTPIDVTPFGSVAFQCITSSSLVLTVTASTDNGATYTSWPILNRKTGIIDGDGANVALAVGDCYAIDTQGVTHVKLTFASGTGSVSVFPWDGAMVSAQSVSVARMGIAQRLFQIQRGRPPRVMVGGDSVAYGTGYNGGLRASIAAFLIAMGISPYMVGDDTGNSNERILIQTLYQRLNNQAKGGITAAQFYAGSSPLTAFTTALATNKPDIVFLHLGTNGILAADVDNILAAVAAYDSDCQVVWMTPYDSGGTSLEYLAYDSSRAAYVELIKARALASPYNNCCVIDTASVFNPLARFPVAGTPAVPASTDTVANTFTFTADPGWYTTQEIIPAATGGGLTAGTTYYAIRTASKTYSLATSRANAIAGTALDITASITQVLNPNIDTAGASNVAYTSNAHLVDSTHGNTDFNGILAAAVGSAIFGMSFKEALNVIQTMDPWGPTGFNQAAAVSNGQSWTPLGQTFSRKKVIQAISCVNPDASNVVTLTVLKTRFSGDKVSGSPTVSRVMTMAEITIPVSGQRGYSYDVLNELTKAGGSNVLHYGEELSFSVATGGSAPQIHVQGSNVLA